MSKSKADKRINRIVRKINKELAEDVFGDRFYLRQVKKTRGEYDNTYYMYEMCDRQEPNRNSILPAGWLNSASNVKFIESDLFWGINDFIIWSDFWYDYWLARGKETTKPEDKYAAAGV